MGKHFSNFSEAISFSRPRAKDETRSQQRDRLEERMKEGILFVQKTWEEIERFPTDLTLEEFDRWVAYRTQLLAQAIPMDLKLRQQRLTKIGNTLKKDQKSDTINPERIHSLRQERHVLESDQDAHAHERFSGMTASLRKKYLQIASWSINGEEEMKRQLVRHLKKRNFPASAIKQVIVRPFDITYIVDDAALQLVKIKEGGADIKFGGLHLGGTPFCLVSDQVKDPRSTIRHERLHNLFTSFVLSREGVGNETYKEFLTHERDQLVTDTEGEFGHYFFMDLAEQALYPTFFIDGLQDELLAAMEQAEEANFGSKTRFEDHFRSNPFDFYRTAGNETNRMLHLLAEQHPAKQIEPDLGVYERRLHEGISKGMERLTRALAIAYDMTLQLKTEGAVEALSYFHAACFSLRPSQWTRIPRLIQSQYEAYGSQDIYRQSTYRYDLQKDPSFLQNVLDEIEYADRTDVRRSVCLDYLLSWDNFCTFVSDHQIRSLATYRQLIDVLQTPATTHSVEVREDAMQRLSFGFFAECLDHLIKNRFETLPPWSNVLSLGEREAFREAAITSLYENYEIEELWESTTDPEQEIPWDNLRKLGIEDVVRDSLNEYRSHKET